MKNPILLFVLLCWACAKSVDYDAEKTAITRLIDDETNYAAAADSVNWSNCWTNTDEAMFIITSANSTQQYNGWPRIMSAMKDAEPFELKLNRDHYNFTIGSDVAFVSFNQQDNGGGSEERKTKESRTLKKVDGHWKIVRANVIDVSSYERQKTNSFHVAKEKIAVDPKTSFRNQSGLGGMYIGYVEVPAATDFTPFFAGLPQDMCPSPHWGYVFEGSIRLKYPDGKEEIVKSGEVFYWPAPHTAVVDKNVKLIDFSPEPEFSQLMEHIAKKMAEQKAK